MNAKMLSATKFAPCRPLASTRTLGRPNRQAVVLRAKADEPKETSSSGDSYSKIEAPVRDTIPDGGKPVEARTLGQNELDKELQSKEWNPDKDIFGTKVGVADAMRFTGAIPEVANCRLAMVGVIAAIAAEVGPGHIGLFQQWQVAKFPIIATFFILTVATAVPVLKGTPRRGNGFWSADAELINGRLAMVGFAAIVLSSFYRGSFWFLHNTGFILDF